MQSECKTNWKTSEVKGGRGTNSVGLFIVGGFFPSRFTILHLASG